MGAEVSAHHPLRSGSERSERPGPSAPATRVDSAGAVAEQEAPRDPGYGPVVIGARSAFEGLLTYRGHAQVEGQLRGQILCRGGVRLGESSAVFGTIEVDELIVAGEFEGEATARQRIELRPTARVRGVIRAPVVALADGCVLQGRCETLAVEDR